MTPQVVDSTSGITTNVDSAVVAGTPVPPVKDGNGNIFVSVVSYRDGERCGETLKSIFENAKDPNRVIVGLVEQNDAQDKFCLEEYCKSYGVTTLDRRNVREGMTKVVANPEALKNCPHADQVKYSAIFHINAKGPIFARSLSRKILGNEEFCMQVDAHMSFAKHWDEMVLEEWHNTDNEFGIITSVPPPKSEQESDSVGGDKGNQVPRQCKIEFRENRFPNFESPADGYAQDLIKPLLAHGWSASFSFAKCHLEESAPYDPFLHYALPIEQFSRYVRLWTRGYDTYTPTRNIVFHDYGIQPNGHGGNEWFKRQRDRFRVASIKRVQTALQIEGGEKEEKAQANMGIYGLGKRRTLQQFQEFANMDFQKLKGNSGPNQRCSGFGWVPYDASISPVDNLFDNPDNLDPQPEFPLRSEMVFYEQVLLKSPHEAYNSLAEHPSDAIIHPTYESQSSLPSLPVLFILWVLGLVCWCVFCMKPSSSRKTGPKKKRSSYLSDSSAYKDV